ncbi:MAG: hypothetical protein WBD40_16775 [Tepidisphaeraceae bacterium]
MTYRLIACVMATMGASIVAAAAPTSQPAFPGAEGFGKYAQGGRGGQVLFVDNLNDAGPGSLRAAVDTKGPRTIVFNVSGTIQLEKGLVVREPFVTIAGQTAPGDGICLANYELYIAADDAIVRYLRCRPGSQRPGERDGITVRGVNNTIVDHCSASWAVDEVLSTTNAKNVTVQWCIIAEALHDAGHHKGNHGFGGLIHGEGVSYHHNLYAHNRSRNPRPASGLIDFRNNVIYDWNGEAGYAGTINKQRLNYVANYLKPGPSTIKGARHAFHTGGPESFIFFSGNVLEGIVAEGADDTPVLNLRDNGKRATKPHDVLAPATEAATAAMARVLDDAGATLPKRDAVDARVIENFKAGSGRLVNSVDEAGGWPELKSASPPNDSDKDGMPDEWEQAAGLDAQNADDRNADADGDGYSNLEEYLNRTEVRGRD